MKHKPLPPLKELRERLDYNPDTGILTWKKSNNNGLKVGQEAGRISSDGYRDLLFNKERWQVNRIVYYMYHGLDPLENQVDHKNHDRADNRIKNLRLANLSQNKRNSRVYKNNSSGVTGVYWYSKTQKWIANITKIKGEHKHLGYFINKEDAIQAREEAEIKYFGEFRRQD